MEKDVIFKQRKELKQAARKSVRGHYLLLTFITAVMILFGTEHGDLFSKSDRASLYGKEAEEGDGSTQDSPGSILDNNTVLGDIMTGRLMESLEKSDKLSEEIKEKGDVSKAIGRTNGIFAELVNSFSAGKPFAILGNAIYSIVRSEKGVAVIFILVSFLIQF